MTRRPRGRRCPRSIRSPIRKAGRMADCSIAVSTETSAVVPATRLSLISRLRAAVQRPAAIGAPARCTTASAPASACDRSRRPPRAVPLDLAGGMRLTADQPDHLVPGAGQLGASALPMSPDEPLTMTLMASSSGMRAGRDRPAVNRPTGSPARPLPARRTSPACGYSPSSVSKAPSSSRDFSVMRNRAASAPVDEPVIVGECQVDHGAHRDHSPSAASSTTTGVSPPFPCRGSRPAAG